MLTKHLYPALALTAALVAPPVMAAVDASDVVKTYVDIAHASFEDALITARNLDLSINRLIAHPSEPNLAAARAAWRAARVPYLQTEVFRFGNPEVDDWEGRVNAWPLDEGLIDYVDIDVYGEESDENPFYGANIIANPHLKIAGRNIDAGTIDKTLIGDTLNEIDGIESNVARGYHAIEFLLWGQDLNGTGPGAGHRPASDFDPAHCTNGHCDRRAAYLKAATELLIDDLAEMSAAWSPGGAIRTRIEGADTRTTLAAMTTGIGSLSYGELAGERMKLGLMLHDPEEEQDCFSDNTHWSHFYDERGMRNVYLGHYRRVDGRNVGGPSLSDRVAAVAPQADADMRAKLDASNKRFQALADAAEGGESYDQLIAAGNKHGNAIVRAAIDALLDQAKAIETVIAALDLDANQFEGSDSLDAPDKVGH